LLEYSSNYNSISGNNITANNVDGIRLYSSSSNSIFRNNFVNNAQQVYSSDSVNTWDDGYPSGGNYWSDYNGTDLYSGPYQNITGSDGIGDTPYIIDGNNRDRYPFTVHNIAVTSVTPSKTVVGQGYSLNATVTVANQGDYTETFNVTIYANPIIGEIYNIDLTSGNFTTVPFTWNTTGFAKGNYTISAVADTVPNETDTADNSFADGVVHVGVPGNVNYFDGSRMVDMIDLWLIQKYYGAVKGQPGPLYVPNYDIDDNGKIDMIDLWIAQKNFGQTEP